MGFFKNIFGSPRKSGGYNRKTAGKTKSHSNRASQKNNRPQKTKKNNSSGITKKNNRPVSQTASGASEKNNTLNLVSVITKKHYDTKGGHPHVIVDNIDDKHISVGLTTKETKGNGSTNYRLEKSPFDDGKISYARRQGIVDDVKKYNNPKLGTLTQKDYEQVKIYGERAKEKYLNKKINLNQNENQNEEK